MPARDPQPEFVAALTVAIARVNGLIQKLVEDQEDLPGASGAADPFATSAAELIERVLDGFHRAACAMRKLRHDGRPTLHVNDEYDVQDVLSYLLSPTLR
jgi:hypothetical protein